MSAGSVGAEASSGEHLHAHPHHLIAGGEHHGVTRLARQLAVATGCPVTDTPGPGVDPARAGLAPGTRLHVHFTDRLWGTSPAQAAEALERLAALHPLSVTLHDLPQVSDGPSGQARRGDAYRRVVTAARAVVLNSHWERELLAALAEPAAVAVIPLPVISPAPAPAVGPVTSAARGPASVGLLGWIYPGKGHAEVIAAAGDLLERGGVPVRVLALGGVSDGHDADAAELMGQAARRNVEFSITGYLSDAELQRHAAQITVPVAAHQHFSASGSINSWLGFGRRPLVSDSIYTREMSALRPGSLTLFAASELSSMLERALGDPDATWLDPAVGLAPDLADVAESYRRFWSETVPG